MKSLASKLTVSVGIATLFFSTFLFYQTYALTDQRISEAAQRQAAMGLQFNLSVREYVALHVRPLMYELLGEDEFIPEVMSTSFVARRVFEEVRKEFPQYIIKFSSDNPRNPANQAGLEELAVIRYFNENPGIERWSGRIEIDGRQYLSKFSARRMETSCLRCHGEPEDAPRSMIERYGDNAGFHRPLGEVIGLDMVAIPLSEITAPLWRESVNTFLNSGLAVVAFFIFISMIFRFYVTRPLSVITRHVAEASTKPDYKAIDAIPVNGDDEIGSVSRSFNALFLKIQEFYATLENKVKERTADLLHANKELRREVNARKKTEKELELTQFVIDHFSDPVFFMGKDGRVVFVNKAACESLQYTEKELLQMTAKDVNPDIVEEEWQGAWKALAHKGSLRMETVHQRKDGTVFPVEAVLNRIIFSGDEYNCAFVRDISERKQTEMEKRRLERRLNQAMKMEAIGTLAGGVAHDLNNILSGIVSYPELMLLKMPEDHELRGSIQTIKKSGEKAAVIVQDLLTLARRGVSSTEPVNLNRIIQDFLDSPESGKMLAEHPDCIIQTDYDVTLLNINGSEFHLSKMIMNLVSNALEAMPDGGVLTLCTENYYIDHPVQGADDIQEGDYVRVSISDTGLGISDDDQERIFEPFYTRKVMGRSGTGLGMTVVWGTIKDHGGFIDITSQPGSGTTFKLYFPATRKLIRDALPSFNLSEVKGSGEHILVVDDILEQRQIATAILEQLGYKVTTAVSGEEAVEYLTQHTSDLVVLDMIMAPGIDGLETYKKVLKVHPGQRAVIVSGFSEGWRVKAVQQLGAGEYVRKPYTIDKIGKAVKNVLNPN